MSATIATLLKEPVEKIYNYKQEQGNYKGDQQQKMLRAVFLGLLRLFTTQVYSIDVLKMDKAEALEELKSIDGVLDQLEDYMESPAYKEETDKLTREAIYEFYDSLDNLSCSLSTYLDEKSMAILDRLAEGDQSDFSDYNPNNQDV